MQRKDEEKAREAAASAEERAAGAEPDGGDEKQPAGGGEAEDAPAAEGETAEPEASRIAVLEQQLLDARCRLAAFAAGVAPELAGDAVTLAVQAAREAGEVTPETVGQAVAEVLQRHPEWKAARRGAGGFRLGADAEERPDRPETAAGERRRWNRFR